MSGRFTVEFYNDDAAKEYRKLDGSVKKLVNVGLKKLETRADEIGKQLEGGGAPHCTPPPPSHPLRFICFLALMHLPLSSRTRCANLLQRQLRFREQPDGFEVNTMVCSLDKLIDMSAR